MSHGFAKLLFELREKYGPSVRVRQAPEQSRSDRAYCVLSNDGILGWGKDRLEAMKAALADPEIK